MTNVVFWLIFQWSLFLNGPIDYSPALIWIVACRQIGDKSLFEPMLTQSIDAYESQEFGGGGVDGLWGCGVEVEMS